MIYLSLKFYMQIQSTTFQLLSRVEMDETDETGEPELLKSGGRKLPGPKAQGS